ncbi:hypothetical protein [Streptomyces sp. CS131]|uniref:hypothetical protein n=1 Tax=Streptomyces sp. CS131 TaxID=2162711 RepID=UPI000D5082FF|nr:hypothetical protein [Streptomyces sp. CS131]PVC92143.1 hypothetical protein DBP20_00120 [Streptomyces sp. CS131]
MTTPSSTAAPAPFGWCHWHKGPSGTTVMVDIVEQNSGLGAALYACAPCREQCGLTAVVEQAYRDYLIHTTDCAGCSRLGRCDVGGRLRDLTRTMASG